MTLSETLKQVLGNLGLYRQVVEHQAISMWPEMVGAAVARHSRAREVRRGTLMVATSGPAWSQELSFMKDDLMRRLNSRLGSGPVVTDIRFYVDRSRLDSGSPSEPEGRPQRLALRLAPLTSEGAAWVRCLWASLGHMEPAERKRLVLLAARKRQRDELMARRGWSLCRRCRVAIPQEARRGLCSSCRVEMEAVETRVKGLLKEAPWLSTEELVEIEPGCTSEVHGRAREDLAQQWRKDLRIQVDRGGASFLALATNLVMLGTGKSADLLKPDDFWGWLPRRQAEKALGSIMDGSSSPSREEGRK